MSDILLCNRPLSAQDLNNQCGISIDQISSSRCAMGSVTAAHTPYLIGTDLSAVDSSILHQLSPAPVAKELTNLSLAYGGDNVTALAEITAQLHDYNIGLIGASTSVYANRIGGFAGSVKDYQAALMEYRLAVTENSPMKAALKQKAHSKFQIMQSKFRHELRIVSGQVKSRRGTPLTSAERATNIAASSRNVARLNVTSQIEANNLVRLSQQAKLLGNGFAVIDFGGRIGNIHNSYQAGGNWERDLFIESSSFAASAIAGSLAVKAGLAILMVATPAGWVGLVIGGLAVAGAAATTSIAFNNSVQENSGDWYDAIMNVLGVK